MHSLLDQLSDLRTKAMDNIADILEKRGSGYELCDPEDDDAIIGCPNVLVPKEKFGVTDYTEYFIYAIRGDTEGLEGIYFDIYNPIEGDEHIRMEEVETVVLLRLSDLIDELEN